jgi:ubiquinone/menaquinone biosynthesis C-methylase UbiE
MKKKWTGERLETFVQGEFVSEHLHRYCISNQFISNKVVLDIASGEGYGSNLLSKHAKHVIGVDIDNRTIEKAKIKYKKSNLIFRTGSADKIPVEDRSIDVVISFETIEHHDKHQEMFNEIKRVLKPDGILIMSSPDKKYHSDLTNKNNEFHVKELYLEEFENFIKSKFIYYDIYFQRYINQASFIASVDEFNDFSIFSGDFNDIYPRNLKPLYNIIVASDSKLEKVKLSVFDGELLTKKMNQEAINAVYCSTTFKVGKIIMFPFFIIKQLLKMQKK